MQELFIYYRCDHAHVQRVRSSVFAWQRELGSRHPALRCRLMRRADLQDGMLTWMEIYACDGTALSLDEGAPLRAELVNGPPAIAALIDGERHVEGFIACAW